MIMRCASRTFQSRTRHCFLVGSLLFSSCRFFSTTFPTSTTAHGSTGSSTGIVVAEALNIALITGNSRTDGPPRPILGPRVTAFIQQGLERRGNTVTVLDPISLNLPLLEKPYFAYSKRQVPQSLEDIHQILSSSNAYVMITPEYNHAPSPALINLLNHFGSSTFSFKPSAIVTYSAGQWGGTRAGIALRPILSELGCLPVSAMIHIPKAQTILQEDGSLINSETQDEEEWRKYTDRTYSQLEWWGDAARRHREIADPFETSPIFQSNPSQRNAP